jgi:hypothetical protein
VYILATKLRGKRSLDSSLRAIDPQAQ